MAELNAISDGSHLKNANAYIETVAAGSTLTLTRLKHAGKLIQLDTLTGSTVTLPAATGSGAIYQFVVSVLATSNSHIIQTSATTEHMQGWAMVYDAATSTAQEVFRAATTSDTITLNGTTTGNVTVGEWITIIDVASTIHHVRAYTGADTDPATPFSAAV